MVEIPILQAPRVHLCMKEYIGSGQLSLIYGYLCLCFDTDG